MIKYHFEVRFDINCFMQNAEYMLDSDMYLFDESRYLHKKGLRLNKKRLFTNPSSTVRDEKESVINYDES